MDSSLILFSLTLHCPDKLVQGFGIGFTVFDLQGLAITKGDINTGLWITQSFQCIAHLLGITVVIRQGLLQFLHPVFHG